MLQQSFTKAVSLESNFSSIARVLVFHRYRSRFDTLSLGATKVAYFEQNKNNQKSKKIARKRVIPDGTMVNFSSPVVDPDVMDWGSMFAAASSFNKRVIPLNVRMGRPRLKVVGDLPPTTMGNVELLKIPNFFHLTPPAIKKHCEKLKEYCTPWPKNIGFRPVRITTINKIFAGPSLRFPEARYVKLQVNLKDLNLDDHAYRKLVLMVGDRYNPNTGELTLVLDRCPTRIQNKEYGFYLLSALYHEANKTEDWESEAANIPQELIDREVKKVRKELYPKYHKEMKFRRTFFRVINNKVVSFNESGHPFLVQMKKFGVKGLLSEDDIAQAKKEWEKIQLDVPDTSTFDLPVDEDESEKMFAGFQKLYGKKEKYTFNV